jgi:hypothetical protein
MSVSYQDYGLSLTGREGLKNFPAELELNEKPLLTGFSEV